MKFNFLLSNFKGYFVLDNFIQIFGSNRINSVYISRDKNVINDYSKEITKLCEQNKIKFEYNLASFEDKHTAFVIGWRKIIENYNNLIVIHDSILPKYSGFQPTVNMLINGEKYIGSTAFQAVEFFDQGPILNTLKIKIKYPIKIQEAIIIQARLYLELCVNITNKIINGKQIKYKNNIQSNKTYSPWRDELDYFIDWSKSADEIIRFVDAVGYPYKGAQTKIDGKIIFVNEVEKIQFKSELSHFGKIAFLHDGRPVVICGKDFVKINSASDEFGNTLLPFNRLKVRLG